MGRLSRCYEGQCGDLGDCDRWLPVRQDTPIGLPAGPVGMQASGGRRLIVEDGGGLVGVAFISST
jgi:hypothetical protein